MPWWKINALCQIIFLGSRVVLTQTVFCPRINLISWTSGSHHPEPCISGWLSLGNASSYRLLASRVGHSWPYSGLSPGNPVLTPPPKPFPNKNSLLKKLQRVLEKNCSPHKNWMLRGYAIIPWCSKNSRIWLQLCTYFSFEKTTVCITSKLQRTHVPESQWRRGVVRMGTVCFRRSLPGAQQRKNHVQLSSSTKVTLT